jgi:sporulation protein YlmC with PRC-barrel domain
MTDPQAQQIGAQEWDTQFHLLDRQIVDSEGRMVGKVDDLELTERFDGRLEITALLTGPGALGPRLGGRLGEWTVAVWRRLHPAVDPEPGRIAVADISQIDNAVHVGLTRLELDVEGLEVWVHEKVISRLPFVGADGPSNRPRGLDRFELPPLGTVRRMSDLLGNMVTTGTGRPLGHVSDARVRFRPGDEQMVVESLVVNESVLRSRFGYERPPHTQPWLLRWLLKATGSRAAGRISWADVAQVAWAERRVGSGVESLGRF